MTAYAYHRNTSVMHAGMHIEAIRTQSNDERRAVWASRFCLRGDHRANGKPRIRIPVTVPEPLSNLPAGPGQLTHSRGERAGRQSNQENQA